MDDAFFPSNQDIIVNSIPTTTEHGEAGFLEHTDKAIEQDSLEAISRYIGPIILSALDKAPVRFIPTQLARSYMCRFITKYALMINGMADSEDSEGFRRYYSGPNSVKRSIGVPVLGARDCYWLGSAAYKLLRRNGVDRDERADKVAQSTGLLLTSNLPDQRVKYRRSWFAWASKSRRHNYFGKLRVNQNRLEVTEDGRVRFREDTRYQLVRESKLTPGSGCPARSVKNEGSNVSMVQDYWQRYARKVFTPFGRKR